MVHRIDRDTSGCILIAKDKQVLESLLGLLQSHKIEKIYHALVFGQPNPPQSTIREKLLRIEDARDEAKVRVDPTGQSAITHYKAIKTIGSDDLVGGSTPIQGNSLTLSLLECRIETGRTHQIRVHLAYIGCPII